MWRESKKAQMNLGQKKEAQASCLRLWARLSGLRGNYRRTKYTKYTKYTLKTLKRLAVIYYPFVTCPMEPRVLGCSYS
jgi:hypothetical protein